MRALPALLLAAVLVGACLPNAAPTPEPTSPPPTASAVAPETQPPPSEESTAPPASEEPAPSTVPPETPPPPSVEPSASGSSEPGSAGACSGSDKNRDFFRGAAASLGWAVYCAVLPAGWVVESGQYGRAGGGRLEIAYRGPGGARLELHEGAFCSAADGCVPAGAESGDASFGDRTGTLVALDGGDWAVVVDRGAPISWLAVGTGMDEAAFRAIAGALALVEG